MNERRVLTATGVRVEFQDAVLCDAKIGHFAECRHHFLRLSDQQRIQATGQIPEAVVVFVCTCERCNHRPLDLVDLAEQYVQQARARAERFGRR